ncbi:MULTISPECIES: GNAT family N-acetyltransferase [Paenibacillus]|uniref:GNAT family N-acetyltransferase n=1 Tax=Paenibacillus TaxID=44249 RepID=UPI0002E13F48|nr:MULTISPECIES: GNAT family N-acetyltransferase [Paenibacillus]KKD55671.1 GCN5 family acetyltransferase [Paenibacillus sp. ICGEB2008]MBE3648437.1 GNAT family N-acetyltransferase [Paenibacillus polymyxa]UNL95974.1 GNAT family acetyltransferase [Paenibacillus polymyxa]SEI86770.1 Predicted acetyltransferase [Paenibacillus polymyxa]
MQAIRLVEPDRRWKDAYLSFYEEWKKSQEHMVPWVISIEPYDFEGMLTLLSHQKNGIGLSEGWVKSSTYWLVDADDQVVGAVNIRHDLNEHLLNAGGHIGYGIRPSARGNRYAVTMLALALGKAKELGISKALVVCDSDNISSKRTILRNGGIPDKDYIEEDGNRVNRFWIEL